MLETPQAVLNASEIAGCSSSRLSLLIMGTNDLAKELYVEPGPDRSALLTSLSLCVLAARAHGKMIVDGVFNDIRDSQGFEVECMSGRRLGFDGKTLIHPSQVPMCNSVFSPSAADIESARHLIQEFEAAQCNGAGVVTVNGLLLKVFTLRSLAERCRSLKIRATQRRDTSGAPAAPYARIQMVSRVRRHPLESRLPASAAQSPY